MMPTVSAPRVTEAVVMQPERLMGSEEWRLHAAWEESEDRARHTAKKRREEELEDEKTVKRYQ